MEQLIHLHDDRAAPRGQESITEHAECTHTSAADGPDQHSLMDAHPAPRSGLYPLAAPVRRVALSGRDRTQDPQKRAPRQYARSIHIVRARGRLLLLSHWDAQGTFTLLGAPDWSQLALCQLPSSSGPPLPHPCARLPVGLPVLAGEGRRLSSDFFCRGQRGRQPGDQHSDFGGPTRPATTRRRGAAVPLGGPHGLRALCQLGGVR
mmetsp:Transcript_25270/g.47255  ORF Transcript_25270/g.47255 Transcript_25270/m.47255 type:complete len:206 (+) Transcript_25270:551-1168(+)